MASRMWFLAQEKTIFFLFCFQDRVLPPGQALLPGKKVLPLRARAGPDNRRRRAGDIRLPGNVPKLLPHPLGVAHADGRVDLLPPPVCERFQRRDESRGGVRVQGRRWPGRGRLEHSAAWEGSSPAPASDDSTDGRSSDFVERGVGRWYGRGDGRGDSAADGYAEAFAEQGPARVGESRTDSWRWWRARFVFAVIIYPLDYGVNDGRSFLARSLFWQFCTQTSLLLVELTPGHSWKDGNQEMVML